MLKWTVTTIHVSAQAGSYTFEVAVHSYQNPTHQSAGEGGDCCDWTIREDPPHCTQQCDNLFILCLRNYSSRSNRTEDCISELIKTDVIEVDNDSLSFTLGEPFPGGVPNPVVISGINWIVSIHACMQINIVLNC